MSERSTGERKDRACLGSTRFQLTLAGEGDLPAVMALAESCSDGPHWPHEAWLAMVGQEAPTQPHRVLLVLRREGGELAGWLAGSLLGSIAELEYLLIEQRERGKGGGRMLLRFWLEWTAQHGGEEALLEVRASNAAARALYRACGFAEQGVRRGYYSSPLEDAILMRCAVGAGSPTQPS